MIQDIDELHILCALTCFTFKRKGEKEISSGDSYNMEYRFINDIDFVQMMVYTICRVNFTELKFSLNLLKEYGHESMVRPQSDHKD